VLKGDGFRSRVSLRDLRVLCAHLDKVEEMEARLEETEARLERMEGREE
jgi:hypothetical protein